jgi:hypothetical protein
MGIEVLAAGGAILGSSLIGANQQKKAAQAAAGAQTAASEAGIAEQQRQFDAIQELLKPFVSTGQTALTQQGNLIGLGGNEAQQQAINQLTASPLFQSAIQQGETALLQNASATGGLRGGNTQAALATLRPTLLRQTIADQLGQLGQVSSMGLGAATQTGQFGQASANNVTNMLGQIGSAQAGAALARGQANAAPFNALAQMGGMYLGSKF